MSRMKDAIESVELTSMTDPKHDKVWIDGKIEDVDFQVTLDNRVVTKVWLKGAGSIIRGGSRVAGLNEVQRFFADYFRSEWFLAAVGDFAANVKS